MHANGSNEPLKAPTIVGILVALCLARHAFLLGRSLRSPLLGLSICRVDNYRKSAYIVGKTTRSLGGFIKFIITHSHYVSRVSLQLRHNPFTSKVCPITSNPCSYAMVSIILSKLSDWISSIDPQLLHKRWWWCGRNGEASS